jgi:hypothetical protein
MCGLSQPSDSLRRRASPGMGEPASGGDRRPPAADAGVSPVIIDDEPCESEQNPSGDGFATAEPEPPPQSEVPRLQKSSPGRLTALGYVRVSTD